MRITVCLLLLISVPAVRAQPFNDKRPPNTYRNADNPHYWKNKPPYAGYWQQDVHYDMDVRLDEQRNVADGAVRLIYWNNSPDTLREVYFHLYQEAFNAGSYYDKLRRDEGGRGFDPKVKRGTELHTIQVQGTELQREQDNTIVRVRLDEPLPPGEDVTFHYTFTSFMRRMPPQCVVKV